MCLTCLCIGTKQAKAENLTKVSAYKRNVRAPDANKINSWYLKVEVHPKRVVSQNKFSEPRKFTLNGPWDNTLILPGEKWQFKSVFCTIFLQI